MCVYKTIILNLGKLAFQKYAFGARRTYYFLVVPLPGY